MRPPDFYQRHLDAVSRTFALCIPRLDAPFRERVALSYLLLRVLDTVEDAPFSDRLLQQRQFNSFRQFLQERPTRAQVDAFRSNFPAGLSEGERALLADTEVFLEDAHELPAAARQVVFGGIGRMAQGMAAYARRPVPLRLLDLEDVCRYCSIVAGLVGEQFALPEAVEALRAVRRRTEEPETIVVAAADPLNLVGVLVPGARLSPMAHEVIAFRDGAPVESGELGTVLSRLRQRASS